MTAVLGVDGGGTSTRCLIRHRHFGTLADVTGEPCAFSRGREKALTSLYRTLGEAIAQAQRNLDQHSPVRLRFHAACLGLSGVATTHSEGIVQKAVAGLLHGQGLVVDGFRIAVVSDSEVALAGALSGRPGVVLIVGTGAVAVGRDLQGNIRRTDGWGWLLGDAGSGYAIGRAALRAAFASLDGKKSPTRLTQALPQHFAVPRLEDIVSLAYLGDWDPTTVAGLARLVAQLADEGDPVCARILKKAGSELAHTALSVVRKLAFDSRVIEVSYQGSVIRQIPLIRDAVDTELTSKKPRCRFLPPELDPAEGAILMGQGLWSC